jgi:hypothetical protein
MMTVGMATCSQQGKGRNNHNPDTRHVVAAAIAGIIIALLYKNTIIRNIEKYRK